MPAEISGRVPEFIGNCCCSKTVAAIQNPLHSDHEEIVMRRMRKRTVKVIYYVFSAMVALLSSSCCSDMRQLNEPERPSKVRGWDELRDGNTVIKGIFLLNKGESTDNGKIGIR